MTNQNNAAQAAEQAIKAAIRKAYDDGYNDAKMAPDNCSTYCAERAVRLDSAALQSALRAPVADERAAFEYHARACELTRDEDVPDDYRNPHVQEYWNGWKARAALASAPVAGEAPSRQTLLDAIWRHGNARAMAEHNIAYRDEVRNTADALIALLDAAPQASTYEVVGEVGFNHEGEKVGGFYCEAPPVDTLLYIASAQPAQKEQATPSWLDGGADAVALAREDGLLPALPGAATGDAKP